MKRMFCARFGCISAAADGRKPAKSALQKAQGSHAGDHDPAIPAT
tara:strand:+ start:324 stop:458 length:135 start_codon:yes stop_codon:yes gene_type:complete